MTTEEKLASRLLYLPLDTQEKIFLWLTHKGLKPVSEIQAEKRDKKYLRLRLTDPEKAKEYPKEKFDINSPKTKRIRKWIGDAGLFFLSSDPSDSNWYIGKKIEDIKIVMDSIRKFDKENQIKTGLLLGFPEEATKAYAENLGKSYEEIKKVMVGTGASVFENEYLKDKYFAPYVFYNMAKTRVEVDSETARIWADTIRKDVPKLAKWFESEQTRKRVKIPI